MSKKIHGNWLQHVGPKSCSLQICCSIKSPLWGGGAIVKDLTPQYGCEEFKSPHLQPRQPWLLRKPN
jgi:hypothetical protein